MTSPSTVWRRAPRPRRCFLRERIRRPSTVWQQAPLQRLGTPADIAEVVSFLAGPARWVNGQIIYPMVALSDKTAGSSTVLCLHFDPKEKTHAH